MLGENRKLRKIKETSCKIFIQLRENAAANCSGFVVIGGLKHKIFSAQFL
jgi:hypothetical protein